jgi:hypothetical protein
MANANAKSTAVLLCYSSAYRILAQRIAADLGKANVRVNHDPWRGGGGLPAFQSLPNKVDEVQAVVVLLTPSESARTWLNDDWVRKVYAPACASGITVLPARGEWCDIPDFLKHLSFADFCNRGYDSELRRLLQAIPDRTDDRSLDLPDEEFQPTLPFDEQAPSATPLLLQVGSALSVLFAQTEDSRWSQSMLMMQDGLFYELGVPFPIPSVAVSSDLPPTCARFVINDVPESSLPLYLARVVVSESAAVMSAHGFDALPTTNPANDNLCAWIADRDREKAQQLGLTIWDCLEFLVLHLSALLRNRAADFITTHEARAMLQRLALGFPYLVEETVPKLLSEFVFSDVLRRLVAEGVSIRNLRRILLALADWAPVESDPVYLTEYARAALQREIMARSTRGTNELTVFLLDPELEVIIEKAIKHTPTGSYVDLAPNQLRAIVNAIDQSIAILPENAQRPAILTVMQIRAAVQRMVAPTMPLIFVVSYQEMPSDINIQPLGRIALNGLVHQRAFTVRPTFAQSSSSSRADEAASTPGPMPIELDTQMRNRSYAAHLNPTPTEVSSDVECDPE